jgi:3-deoxy-7-phosphoheptulonate synthase
MPIPDVTVSSSCSNDLPYRLAGKHLGAGKTTVIDVLGRKVGGSHFATIAGPCAVESRDLLLESARIVQRAGAQLLRGGAYKPRTSPYAFQGLGRQGLELLREAKAETGLPVVTELMDVRELERVLDVADVIQLGARNMSNHTLLVECGRTRAPVLLKRGPSATVEELLLAAEYVLHEGNPNVILCERGIRTFETSYRFTLDLTAVTVLKSLTDLPVFVDPSHAAGTRAFVEPLSLAAVAAGADGLIVEIHPRPTEALCDGPQALVASEFPAYLRRVEALAAMLGRRLPEPGRDIFPAIRIPAAEDHVAPRAATVSQT